MLAFDYLHPSDPGVNAVELEVSDVTAQALRDGLLADPAARQRLFGGSVTLDGRLLLVADLADVEPARAFAKRIGGDLRRARIGRGRREFVEAATAGRARVEKRTLMISGTPQSDTLALRGHRGLEIDFGDDGSADFEVGRKRFDRIRVEGGDCLDSLIVEGSGADETLELSAAGVRAPLLGRIDLDDVERLDVAALDGDDAVTVDDLSGTDVQGSTPISAAATARSTGRSSTDRREEDQVSVSALSAA